MRRVLFCLLLGVPWACDGSDGPNDASTGGNDDGSRFVDDFAALLCDLSSQCCVAHGFGTPADCLVQAKLQLHKGLDPSIDAGARYDAVAGQQCIAAYRGLAPSCPNAFDFDVCHHVFARASPVDGGCSGGCAPSDAGKVSCLTYSTIGVDGGATESGQTCQLVVTVAPGQGCDNYGRMAVERHCDSAKGSNCVQGTCSTPKPIGSSCTANTNECVPEAICTSGSCVARVPIGGTCTGTECVPGSSCDTGKCTESSRWKKICSGDFN